VEEKTQIPRCVAYALAYLTQILRVGYDNPGICISQASFSSPVSRPIPDIPKPGQTANLKSMTIEALFDTGQEGGDEIPVTALMTLCHPLGRPYMLPWVVTLNIGEESIPVPITSDLEAARPTFTFDLLSGAFLDL
jgi:hypothetical protein